MHANAVGQSAAFQPRLPDELRGRVRTHILVRWLSIGLVISLVLLPIALIWLPWQQTVRGRGQIVAYIPTERKQVITARVSGQVGRWHVVEGSKVKAGDRIVDINDNDAEFSERLESQRQFLCGRRQAAQEEVTEQAATVKAQEQAMKAAVRAARATRDAAARQVDVARQSRENSNFALGFEKRRYEMFDKLLKDPQFGGLESQLSRDEALMRADRASTDVLRADAEIRRTEAALSTSESVILQAEATGLSAIATARRDLRRAEQNLFSVERDIQELDSRIERFKARFVVAPVDGTVFRVAANVAEGGQYVKEGDELAVIVPDATDRVVELMIDGVDAPLIAAHMSQLPEGPHVRLQFEGWPAVQFAGWPSVSTGTFGGRVRQIDASDDGQGRFRILVEPDVKMVGDEWPESEYLRQGNQAIGWVFLNRVSLGYEFWRKFNGFPPVVAPKSPEKDKNKQKPPKVKL